MPTEHREDNHAFTIAAGLMAALERAWNGADGDAFAAPFAADADFIDIRGVHHRTRDVIADGHRGIFETIYKGSAVHYEVVQARQVSPTCIVAQARAELDAPSGPLRGVNRAMQTLVVVPSGAPTSGGDPAGDWSIVAFHNTLVRT